MVVKDSHASAGRKGAAAFWKKFKEDPDFRQNMLGLWRNIRHDHVKLLRAARLGGKALWKKYHHDDNFRAELDSKLLASRSRGGSIALRNLGAAGFKSRLKNHAPLQVRPRYVDNNGNLLRSRFEVTVANWLESRKIGYDVEPRFVIGDHAFYPDFMIEGASKRIIEVVGYMGDKYWDGTAAKIRLISATYPDVQIAVVTSFVKTMSRRLRGVSRISFFRPYEQEKLVLWCRGNCRGTKDARRQSGYCAGPNGWRHFHLSLLWSGRVDA